MLNSIPKSGIANYLIQDGLLKREALPALLQAANQRNIPLITHLVRTQTLTSQIILNCCKKNFTLTHHDLTHYQLQEDLLPPEFILRYRTLPISRDENCMQIGMADPTDYAALSALRFHTGLTITPMLVCEKQLDRILATIIHPKRLDAQLETALTKVTAPEIIQDEKNDDEPVSEFLTRLLDDAVLQRISDIHIEPFADHCRIRFRRDGMLYEVTKLPPHFAARLITRVKILANLNIAERRIPQDGRLPAQYATLDIRVNTCPMLHGEKIALRLLNANNIKLDMDKLGLTADQLQLFLHHLSQPQGLILVTGPTGSGKTITLYSALNYLNNIEKNISTAEDPIEMQLDGINQININTRIDLDFAAILRALLRQDPDVIMIGEIRDKQTAAIAVQAAQTGHLVLSTLHTNSALDAISRLQSFGISHHHFISAASLIIAQRLVRKRCAHCTGGCDECHQGYQGRTGIFECLPITNKIGTSILSDANLFALQKIMHEEKYISLREAGNLLITHGVTHEAELSRVLGKH